MYRQKYGKWLSVVLVFILIFIVLIGIVLFISGPQFAYTRKIQQQEEKIYEQHKEIKNMYRHVFYYITYSFQENDTLYWYNEHSEKLTSRALETLAIDDIKKQVNDTYGLHVETVLIGYGYEHPAYIIETKEAYIVIDYDSKEVIYYRSEV